jgi:inorganic triphosphatase YgiF
MELKLSCDPRDVPALLDHPTLSDLAAAAEEHLRSTYFDTPQLDLRSHRVALRVRRENGAWIQCLKGAGSYVGGVHVRREIEAPVEGRKLDLSKLPVEGDWGRLFESAVDRASLQPCFVSDIRRRRCTVHGENGAEIEVALDQGTLKAGRRRRKLCELELELKAGDPVVLLQLARNLGDRAALRVEPVSKAEHGYRLLAAGSATISKARAPELDATLPPSMALRLILAECLRQYHGNEAAALAGDAEAVHQLRVSLRRLRACLGLFKPHLEPVAAKALQREIGWLSEVLGPLRDWDVLLEGLEPLGALRSDDRGLRRLVARGRALREACQRKLVQRMSSARYTRLQLLFAEWVLAPPFQPEVACPKALGTFARRTLKALNRRVRRAGRNFDDLPVDARHRLRIRAKRLRYALQFFSQLYDVGSTKKLTSALTAVQDSLGALNDLALANTLMDQAGSSVKGATRTLVDGWTLAHADTQLSHARGAWRDFLAAPRPWKSKR